MTKDITTPTSAGDDLLRALAGHRARAIHVGRHEIRSRVVTVYRDALGRVTGSTEQIEEVQFLDTEGHWIR